MAPLRWFHQAKQIFGFTNENQIKRTVFTGIRER